MVEEVKFRGQWIGEIYKFLGKEDDLFEFILPILERADVLLQIAASETENEFLHDDIMKLLRGGENGL